ncbi:hypothetical protein SLA2020_517550 [Shorea laevis]
MADNNSSPPLHLCFFLLILFFFMGLSWYVNYEPVMESVLDRVKLLLMVLPLLLLLVVHWLSNNQDIGLYVSYLLPLPAKDSLHGAGGTPWGVGFLLVFLLIMLSFQSAVQERWFPLLSR